MGESVNLSACIFCDHTVFPPSDSFASAESLPSCPRGIDSLMRAVQTASFLSGSAETVIKNISSILAGFKISTPAPFQSPALSSLGMMSQPYMCGAFLTPSESYADEIAPSFRPLDSITAERIITSSELSPLFERRSVMSKEWGISMFPASPIFSPLRNMSANGHNALLFCIGRNRY